nr:DUF1971 domain-containing protein [uncultured Sphingosinicella sp.]
MSAPYKTTPVFDQHTIPLALQREHRTKAGVWGIVRVLEGELRLNFGDASEDQLLTPTNPGLVAPEQPHSVEPIGPVRMQIEFYAAAPAVSARTQTTSLSLPS